MIILEIGINVRDADGQVYGMMIFSAVFIGIFIWLWHKAKASRYWAKGTFPPFLKKNEKNLIEAYTALGALMITVDRDTPREKTDYILNYFAQSFQFVHNNFRENLIYAMRNQVSPKSVTDWLNKQIPSEQEKTKVIQFIAGVGLVDGDLTKREIAFLQMTNSYLGLSASIINTIIEDHVAFNEREHKKAQKRPAAKYVTRAYDVLGIHPKATPIEIKKAYRKLVKVFHPDNFANDTAYKKDQAEEKFIEIQKAYEELTD